MKTDLLMKKKYKIIYYFWKIYYRKMDRAIGVKIRKVREL